MGPLHPLNVQAGRHLLRVPRLTLICGVLLLSARPKQQLAADQRGRGAVVNVSSRLVHLRLQQSRAQRADQVLGGRVRTPRSARQRRRPGPTYTEGTREQSGVQALEKLASRAPARRADPMEIARTVAYLAGDEASFLHGVILNADGGRSAV
ncbi:SDR family oxidoreductase [Actinomadura monticuli]|uniref:SDR family oxidoreductase n=1 Tax=Actinomadura monticuli TaxID=3097367 RepID=UPI003FCC5A73